MIRVYLIKYIIELISDFKDFTFKHVTQSSQTNYVKTKTFLTKGTKDTED